MTELCKDCINAIENPSTWQCKKYNVRTRKEKDVCVFEEMPGHTTEFVRKVSRPDQVLNILEAWVRHESERGFKNYNPSEVASTVCWMIDKIKTNPETVRERGLKEGWYHD